jgi:HSP20 family protein
MRRKESMPYWPSFMDEFFSRDWMDWNNQHFSVTNTTLPAVNVKETNDEFVVEMAAPGMDKKDFTLKVDNNILTIRSEKKSEKEEKEEGNFTRREFSYQSFSRSFTLPNFTDDQKISAVYQDGILKVVIPKREEAKPKPSREISIK